MHAVGTEARLLRHFTGRDGSNHAIVQGLGRIRIDGMAETGPDSSVNRRDLDDIPPSARDRLRFV